MLHLARRALLASLLAAVLAPSLAEATSKDTFAPKSDGSDKETREYYLIFDGEPYDGDTLVLKRRKFRLKLNDWDLKGRLFKYDGVTVLWDRKQRVYVLVSLEKAGDGAWNSCWGSVLADVKNCEGSTVVARIQSENPEAEDMPVPAASAPADEPLVRPMPEPTPEPALEPEPEPTSESEPAAEPVPEPEPAPEPESAPKPVPEPTTPEPEPEPVAYDGDASKVGCDAPLEEIKAAFLADTNERRKSARRCGNESFAAAPALRWSDSLAKAARGHSRDMASNNIFDHTGSDGLTPADRAVNAGYPSRSAGENISAGRDNVLEVQDSLTRSPGHCANIMRKGYTDMGAACVSNPNSRYDRYWTITFGTR